MTLTSTFHYSQLRHDPVRDLGWVLDSDNDLVKELLPYSRFEVTTGEPTALWLLALDHNPTPLLHFLTDQVDMRLGRYFENLVHFFLAHGPLANLAVLQRNLALRNDLGQRNTHSTIGELDFLLTDTNGPDKVLHLEVAVKFYLGYPASGHTRWLGPNSRDSLEIKLNHLAQHQLPLSQREGFLPYPHVDRAYWVKGYLFQPWPTPVARPASTGAAAIDCWWIHARQCRAFFTADPKHWARLPKSRWLGALEATEPAPTVYSDISTVLEHHFTLDSYPVMLSSGPCRMGKSQRVIVVNDDWPNEYPGK